MNKKVVYLSLSCLMVVSLLLASCAAAAVEEDTVTLEDRTWVLESYGEPGDLHTVLADTEITIEFVSAEGEIEGSAGCNGYFAGYEVGEDELTIKSPMGQTVMACPEPVMNQEMEYLAILQDAESYNIEGGQLQIVGGDKVLVFKRK